MSPRDRPQIPIDSAAEVRLLTRIAAGDGGALARLYDAIAPLAFGIALRITRDPRLAEDAVQDAFLHVWQRAGSFEAGRGAARAWALRIVRNAAIDLVRLEGTQRRTRSQAEIEPEREGPDSPEDRLGSARDAFAVRSALDELPEDQRRAIETAYFQGLSHSEIATREGIPLGTVKTRIRAGVGRLRGIVMREERRGI